MTFLLGHFFLFQLTIADLVLLATFDTFKVRYAPGIVEKFPQLDAFVAKINEDPKLKGWIEMRPVTAY